MTRGARGSRESVNTDSATAGAPVRKLLAAKTQSRILGEVTNEDPAARGQAERGVGWSQLDGRARWDGLILPSVSRDLLRSIAADLRSDGAGERSPPPGPGLKLMFAGEPGTGKRLAARMLATDIGLPILSVELAGVISRKRSESEERLDHLFEAAERLRAIVYFADAGTWFAERTSHPAAEAPQGIDPDLASLLGRIDGYGGVVIFAATLGIAWEPVIERLDHIVEFPFPGEGARRRIWPLLLPGSAQLAPGELGFLADSFPLTGAAIKRCVVAAASAAASEGSPPELRHFVAAIEREYGDRLHSARVRQALGRFYAGTWDAPAPRPTAGGAAAGAPAGMRVGVAVAPLRLRRRLLRGVVFAAILAAALLGFLIARSPRPSIARAPDLDAHLAAGLLSVAVPTQWGRESPPARPALGLHDEIAAGPAAPAGGVLVVGIESATTIELPAALLGALARPPTAEVVTLGGARFYRYLDLAPSGVGGTESVYLVPTTAGTVLAQCFGRDSAPGFASTCERVLGTIALSSGHVLAIGPSAAYATALDAALTKLDGAVTGTTSRLSAATTATDQAGAATALAAAYRAAASAVGALDAGAAAAANRAVAAALSATGAAYAGLAHAAAVHNTRSYDVARTSVANASAQLRAAIAALATFGYAVR
jgi:ATPase family associated with various cellular activities (AAA)